MVLLRDQPKERTYRGDRGPVLLPPPPVHAGYTTRGECSNKHADHLQKHRNGKLWPGMASFVQGADEVSTNFLKRTRACIGCSMIHTVPDRVSCKVWRSRASAGKETAGELTRDGKYSTYILKRNIVISYQ